MKSKIMSLVNELCSLLDICEDADFVDDVIARVSSNDPFDPDSIAAESFEEWSESVDSFDDWSEEG